MTDPYEELYKHGYKGNPCPMCGQEKTPVHYFIDNTEDEPFTLGFDGATGTPFLLKINPHAGIYATVEVPLISLCSAKCLRDYLNQKVDELEEKVRLTHESLQPEDTQPDNKGEG